MKRVLGFALFAAAVAGCYPKAGPAPGALSPTSVSWASTRFPGSDASSLDAGRQSFLAKCNNCHAYPDLQAIEDDKWPSIVESMGKKAKLEPAQREQVLHYILAARHP